MSRPRVSNAFLKGQGPRPNPHQRRRPPCARSDAQGRLQCWRRAIGPYDPARSCDHRRRQHRRTAGARGAGASRARRRASCSICSIPVPQLLKNVRYSGGAPLENAAVKPRSPRPRPLWRARPAGRPPFGHRAADPRDGRRRRRKAGEGRWSPISAPRWKQRPDEQIFGLTRPTLHWGSLLSFEGLGGRGP